MTLNPGRQPPFQIGQKIFVPWATAHSQKTVQCPICAGKKSVTLILGSGEHVPVECGGCGLGYDGPQGTVNVWEPDSGVREDTIRGIKLLGDQWIFSAQRESLKEWEVYTAPEPAEMRRKELYLEAEEQAKRSFESQFKEKKKHHGWSVAYHRSGIQRLEKSLAWHRAKLTEKVVA
jgi:hypothetical protein